jgi:hypothetical protein
VGREALQRQKGAPRYQATFKACEPQALYGILERAGTKGHTSIGVRGVHRPTNTQIQIGCSRGTLAGRGEERIEDPEIHLTGNC